MSRYPRIAATFDERVRQVPLDAWSSPAPCDGWVVRDVVRHLVEWVPAVIGRSGVTFPASPPVDDDPVGAWSTLHSTLSELLADPTTAGLEFDAGPPGRLTVASAIDMLVVGDLLVHTWDLARAVGLDEQLDVNAAADMLAGLEPIDDMLRASGHYGPKVDVPAGASAQDRLLAFTGRDPNWARP